MATLNETKQARRAAIVRERRRRYMRHEPISPRTCLLAHLDWVSGHRMLYSNGSPIFDIAFCYETLGWARQCNQRMQQATLVPPAAGASAEAGV